MATPRERATTPPARQTTRLKESHSKTTRKSSFRIQSAPPLSIQQYLRSTTGFLRGAEQWRPSGRYRPPVFHHYMPPTIREKKKPVESIWHPPSPYREKPPTSLSPERIKQKHVPEPTWHPPGPYREKPPTSLSPERIEKKRAPEPVWHPPGQPKPEPVPYFDAPSLRWSLQELRRSMPEFRPQTFRSSASMSRIRKSETVAAE